MPQQVVSKTFAVGLALLAALWSATVRADLPVMVYTARMDSTMADWPISESDRTVENAATAFDLAYGLGLQNNQAAKDAFDRAAARWAAVLNDPVTVNITVNLASLGPGILGQTSSTMVSGGFNSLRSLMVSAQEPGDTREASLLPNLPTAAQFTASLPSGFSMDGTALLTTANYRALGGTPTGSDGSITFSSNYQWDYDPSNGIDPGKYDFEGTAAHEMGHLLGFTSEVDYVDYVLYQGHTASNVWPRSLDLFRFATADLTAGFDFTTTRRDLSPGGSHSFYYHDNKVLMSTGRYNGDGRQASHWKDGLGLGIMDPTSAAGELLSITDNDLIALDLIGWDIDIPPALLPGDVNGDGFVGGDDLSAIMTNWGSTTATRPQGDLNADNYVSGYDYNEVLSYWGTGTPPEPMEAVPEPASLALLLLAACIVPRAYRKRG